MDAYSDDSGAWCSDQAGTWQVLSMCTRIHVSRLDVLLCGAGADELRNGVQTSTQDYRQIQNLDENKGSFENRKQSVRDDRVLQEQFEWYDKCFARERNQGTSSPAIDATTCASDVKHDDRFTVCTSWHDCLSLVCT